jgi:hypothetical protein
VKEPPEEQPRRRQAFRLVYDADEHGLPPNAPEGGFALYRGRRFEQAVAVAIALDIVLLCLWTSPTIPTLNETDQAGINVYDGLNVLFVLLFALEALLRSTAFTPREYVRANRFDAALALLSLVGLVVYATARPEAQDQPHMRLLRCVRALRIFRLAQVARS